MGYIIAYLLLTVVVDLLLEMVGLKAPRTSRHTSIAIHRRLWSDTLFDCRSRIVSADAATPKLSAQDRTNRYRLR